MLFTFRAVDARRVIALMVLTRVLEKSWAVRVLEWLRLCFQLRKLVNGLDLLDQMIVRWDEGDNGFDLPYSKEALLRLIAVDPSTIVMIPLSYFSGLREERLKN